MVITPSREEFVCLAADKPVIPVHTDLATDLETPVSLYYKLVGDAPGFMLESAVSGHNFGRYSFLGTKPFARFTGRGGGAELAVDGVACTLAGPPLAALRKVLAAYQVAPDGDLPLVQGGAVGYFAYDLIGTYERVRGAAVPPEAVVCVLLFCQVLVVMDHLTHSSRLVVLARPRPGEDAGQVYDAAVSTLVQMKERLARPASPPNAAGTAPPPVTAYTTAEEYAAIVRRAQDYIRAGEIFQVVPSQRLTAPLTTHPFTLYRRLRRANPSPYMFYLNFGARQLVGASPEMLVQVADGRVTTKPIAGTRPRGRTPAQDQALAAELLADEKERAEHTMLVNLGRNDLGRVCVPGTVQVDSFMKVEYYSHVMHLVSTVSGQLRSDLGPVDALAACFPAGTVSGAPKVRAMEIIRELEGGLRGPYAGAVGYIDFAGRMDTCIAIRTMVIDKAQVAVQAGGGVVYDSEPTREYAETLYKARALLQVLQEVD